MSAEAELEQLLRRIDAVIDRTARAAMSRPQARSDELPEYMARPRRRPRPTGAAVPTRRARPGASSSLSDLIRPLDYAPDNYRLSPAERNALRQLTQILLTKNIPGVKEGRFVPQSLRNQMQRRRFRFLRQIPAMRERLLQALLGTGVSLPPGW